MYGQVDSALSNLQAVEETWTQIYLKNWKISEIEEEWQQEESIGVGSAVTGWTNYADRNPYFFLE